jgi:opacity protein-like surface antigen
MGNISLLLLLLLPAISVAQTTLYIKATAGNYWMNDIKKNQEEFKTDLLNSDIPVKEITSFPPSIQGELGVDFTIHDKQLRHYLLGGFINYTVTEGRLNYSDYSGSLDIIHNLKRVAIGMKGMHDIQNNFSIYGKIGVSLNQLEIKSNVSLQSSGLSEEAYHFNSMGLAVEPGIQWTKMFHRTSFFAYSGYELNLNGKTKRTEESYLIDNSGDPVFIDWSGFRLGIGVSFSL